LPEPVLRYYDALRPDLIAASDEHKVFGPRRGGCGRCGGTGYSDLIGVFELLDMTKEIKDAYKHGRSELELETLAREAGFRSMLDAGVDHIISGFTSYEALSEVLDTGVRAL
jgi:type II secretory ATPase GspE/PulE/Tfp pilus assembly ATPase PilB-like protein